MWRWSAIGKGSTMTESWRLRLLPLAVFLILVLAGGFALVSAAPIIPNNSDGFASAAYDPVNDRYLLVYEKSDNGDRDIWARFVSNSGDYLAPEFPITTDTPHERSPAVAYDSVSGKYLAVWRDYRNSNWDIYGQFIDGDNVSGLLYSSEFAIADSASEHSVHPALVFDETTARFLVIWSGLTGYPGGNLISGQFVNSASSPSYLFSVNFPLSTVDSNKYSVAVANDPVNDRFLAVWEDRRSGIAIYGQIVDSASGGGFLYSTDASTNLPIATGAAYGSDPDVAYSGSTGRFMVVWTDSRDADGNIYGQLIDADTGAPYGTSVDTNFPVSTAPSHQRESALAAGPDGNYLVVFSSVTGPEYDILGQLVDGEGAAVATSTDVNYPVADSDEFYYRPGVVYNPGLDNYLFYFDNESVSPYEVVLLVDPPRESSGGGGGGGCNTTSPAPGEPVWVDLLWIAMLVGMFILMRRKYGSDSRFQDLDSRHIIDGGPS